MRICRSQFPKPQGEQDGRKTQGSHTDEKKDAQGKGTRTPSRCQFRQVFTDCRTPISRSVLVRRLHDDGSASHCQQSIGSSCMMPTLSYTLSCALHLGTRSHTTAITGGDRTIDKCISAYCGLVFLVIIVLLIQDLRNERRIKRRHDKSKH